MKLSYTVKGLKNYHGNDSVMEPRFQRLQRLAHQKSIAQVEIGDNLLFEYGNFDVYFLIKVKQKTKDSIVGLVIESNAADYPENTTHMFCMPEKQILYMLDDSDLELAEHDVTQDELICNLLGIK